MITLSRRSLLKNLMATAAAVALPPVQVASSLPAPVVYGLPYDGFFIWHDGPKLLFAYGPTSIEWSSVNDVDDFSTSGTTRWYAE